MEMSVELCENLPNGAFKPQVPGIPRLLWVVMLLWFVVVSSAVVYNAFFHQPPSTALKDGHGAITLEAVFDNTRPEAQAPKQTPDQVGGVKALEDSAVDPVVRDIQEELIRLKIYHGPLTGVFDQGTREALFTYRRRHDLLTISSLKELHAHMLFNRDLSLATVPSYGKPVVQRQEGGQAGQDHKAQGGDKVRFVQRALLELGYGLLEETGKMDPDTRRAIMEFQRERGMIETGEISQEMLKMLEQTSGVNSFLDGLKDMQ